MISHTRTNPHPTCQFHELRFVKVGHDLRSHNRGCIGQLSTLIESAFCFSITIPTNHVIQQILKENTHSHKSIVSLTSFRSLALQKPTPKNRGWVLELLVGNGDRKKVKIPLKEISPCFRGMMIFHVCYFTHLQSSLNDWFCHSDRNFELSVEGGKCPLIFHGCQKLHNILTQQVYQYTYYMDGYRVYKYRTYRAYWFKIDSKHNQKYLGQKLESLDNQYLEPKWPLFWLERALFWAKI